jgi:hypothetical protein
MRPLTGVAGWIRNRILREPFVGLPVAVLFFSGLHFAAGNQPARILPGLQAGGSVLLPNQWSLRRAGTQLKLGVFPVNITLHPNDRWLAVLHTGFGRHEVVTVDLERQVIVDRAEMKQAFYGLCRGSARTIHDAPLATVCFCNYPAARFSYCAFLHPYR